jgi:nicotinamide riboside transporter PnuC
MTWILTALSLIGVVLNIYKLPECFIVWAFTNIAWAIVDYRKGLTAQAFMFFVYFCMSVWGMVVWK